MKKITFLRLEVENLVVKNRGLSLCGQNVWMLNPILKEQIEVEESVEDDFEMKISFFTKSRFCQTISCRKAGFWDVTSDKECIEPPKSGSIVLGKIAIAVSVQENDIKQGILLQRASKFIRKSETLNEEELKELPNEWRSLDGRGLVLFGKNCFVAQAKREIFLVMLGLAYYRALQQINDELARMLLENYTIEQLDELYKDASEFNACYYFHNPIEFFRYPTFKAWQDIREAYHLQAKNQEVTSQLVQVHQILSYRQQKKENQISETRNNRLAFLGILLSALGIIEVIDVLKNWFGF